MWWWRTMPGSEPSPARRATRLAPPGPARAAGEVKGAAGQRVSVHAAGSRLDDPVVRNAIPRVELKLAAPIDLGRREGKDLGGQRRRSLDTPGAGERRASRLEVHDVGLDDCGVAEDAIHGRHEYLAQPLRADVLPEEHEDVPDEPLVLQARRGGHKQLAVVQLVTPPVGRQRLVVPIGEDDSRRHLRHPDQESITPSVLADGTRTRNV